MTCLIFEIRIFVRKLYYSNLNGDFAFEHNGNDWNWTMLTRQNQSFRLIFIDRESVVIQMKKFIGLFVCKAFVIPYDFCLFTLKVLKSHGSSFRNFKIHKVTRRLYYEVNKKKKKKKTRQSTYLKLKMVWRTKHFFLKHSDIFINFDSAHE